MHTSNPIATRLNHQNLRVEDLASKAEISFRTAYQFTRPIVKGYLSRKTSVSIDKALGLAPLTTMREWEDFQTSLNGEV